MTLDDLIAEHSKAKKQAEDHWKLHQQWLGVMAWLEKKIETLKVEPPTQGT